MEIYVSMQNAVIKIHTFYDGPKRPNVPARHVCGGKG